MLPTEPLPLHHSWPLFARGTHFALGALHGESAAEPWMLLPREQEGGVGSIGYWDCDLEGGGLRWSPTVYRLFGLPSDTRITRADALRVYTEESRAAMERLRSHAIRHKRGFTMDVRLRGGVEWMRLTTAPVIRDGRVVRLQGLKQDISACYR